MAKKIGTVDMIILSHPNSDHLNGLLYIIEHFNVKDVWTNNEAANTIAYKKFISILKMKQIQVPVYSGMNKESILNKVIISLLYPPDDFHKRKKYEKWRNSNNNSVVVMLEFGSKSFIFSGDIMSDSEKELVSLFGEKLDSTVLIAPHHGSGSSSSHLFIDSVKPEIVIISSGERPGSKFPNQLVLQRSLMYYILL